jgi:phosphomannomutase
MISCSHISFDRNGIKFYRLCGEVTKVDEQAILNSSAELISLGRSYTSVPIDTEAEAYSDID